MNFLVPELSKSWKEGASLLVSDRILPEKFSGRIVEALQAVFRFGFEMSLAAADIAKHNAEQKERTAVYFELFKY